jgi:[protein-PII] uridylyltransferase
VQHDLYHVYTVDTHSIFAVDELSKLASDVYDEKFPSYKKALLSVQRKDLLSFGLLFHDIGKGEGGNHSVIGAKMTHVILSRFGYSQIDQEVVEFLVISHLIMPHLSQRRDLEDQQLIAEFAKSVKTLERLNMLYVLTWADIRAVSAEAWTDWKGNLLTELYEKTKNVILGQELYEDYVRRRVVDVRRAILERMKSKVDFIDLEAFLETMSPRYVMAHNDDEIVTHYNLINEFQGGTFLFHEQEIPGTSVSEVLIYTLNNPRLLPLVTGVTLALGINILVLEVFTLKNGYIFLKLSLQSAMQSSLSAGLLVENLKQNLNDVFLGVKNVNQLIAKRKKPQILIKQSVQRAATKIQIDNDVSAYYTVIDIYTHDRIGLLYDIIRCLAENGCYVEVSKISTKVEQVVDSFYVKDIFGHKITSKDKLTEIKTALFAVIDEVTEPDAMNGAPLIVK